jgi:hypothetical protein
MMTPEQQKIIQQLAQMGEVVYVKKDGSRIVLNEEGNVSLKTQADAVLYFIQNLDNDMLNLVLDENRQYQDYDKHTFIKKLSYAFDIFYKRGNTYLNRYEGKCNSGVCTNSNCIGFSFVGNKTNDYMDLILEIKNDRVLDIYECSKFENDGFELTKKKKITLDNELPF